MCKQSLLMLFFPKEKKIKIVFKILNMRVSETDAEKEMHYIDRFTHRPRPRRLDGALTKSPVNHCHHVLAKLSRINWNIGILCC